MPNTTAWTIPYPALTDAPNGPAQMQALAERVDTVMQLRVVSATSDVAAPYTGQMVFSTADLLVYRYTGSAWKVHLGGANAGCRYYRANTSNVAFAANAPVSFDTADHTSSLITASGTGNTTFTVGQDGWYDIKTSIRQSNVAALPYVWIMANGINRGGADGQASNTFWMLNVAADAYLLAGQTIQVQQNGLTLGAEAAPSQSMFITIKYDGP